MELPQDGKLQHRSLAGSERGKSQTGAHTQPFKGDALLLASIAAQTFCAQPFGVAAE
jgi:hypothetical protein